MNAQPVGSATDSALREELLGGAGAESGDMRASLLSNTERVERTGKRLHEGLRVAYETEEIGGQILGDLDQQRETIQRSRDRVGVRLSCMRSNFITLAFSTTLMCGHVISLSGTTLMKIQLLVNT